MAEAAEKERAPPPPAAAMPSPASSSSEQGAGSVKLFVGQVPKAMTEAQLLAMFKEFALVDEVSVIRDKATKASRGCCFLICPSREEADKAVGACHNKRTLPGASSPLQVKYADGELERLEHKLFIGMLPKNVSDAEVSSLFSKYGNIKDLQILRGSQHTSKGCAFLKYETKEQALAALEAVNGKCRMEGSSVPLVVKWADTEKERQARRAQKAQSQASNLSPNSIQQPSVFGALPMGYMPPYNGYGYQAPGNYGLLQYPLASMQNQASFQNMVSAANQGNSLRGINPELSHGAAARNFATMQSTGYVGSAYQSVAGLQYPLAYHGGIMSHRPSGNSLGLVHPANTNSNNSASPPGISTSSGGQIEWKSKRLYELLQLELLSDCESNASQLASEFGSSRDLQENHARVLSSRESIPGAGLVASIKGETSGRTERTDSLRESEGVSGEDTKHLKLEYDTSISALESKQMARKTILGSKLRRIYRKQKTLRKKLFPWNYDWHRDQQHEEERVVNQPGIIRRCKPGQVDHNAVLQALTRALEATEEAYMAMVETSLDVNPELALMGSCVLVMLMKDQDVYVINLGDSRVILAQDRLSERNITSNLVKDDTKHRNRSRESLVRVELDRISEESPMHNPNSRVCTINKNKEISLCRLKLRAVQLSTDHSTGIEEEVLRIKAEHTDDAQAVLNERVKGQLKVTRAFGAGFLKKPKFNEALLEMFRIDYIGSSPYLSCVPSVIHHRLCSSDRFLVLSSDGLYQYFSNEDVVSHVAWFMENVQDGDPAQYLISELLFRAAKKNGMDFHELLDIPQGDRRKYHDDVSVMVISLEGRIWRSAG